MLTQNTFKLILRNKNFFIPCNFTSIEDINQAIYKILLTKGEYEVNSDVNENILKLFIDNWVKQEAIDLNLENINEFDLLTQEFDHSRDQIELFYKFHHQELQIINDELKSKLNKRKDIINKKKVSYNQIIHSLYNQESIETYSDFLKLQKKLQKSCFNYDAKTVNLLTMKRINYNGLTYSINQKEKNAILLGNHSEEEDIIIPASIQYKSQEFIVTQIHKKSEWDDITTIEFEANSKLNIIQSKSFESSYISKIVIPASVTEIGKKAFNGAKYLKVVEFAKNSQLKVIREQAFCFSGISKMLIPSSVTKICELSFHFCQNLTSFEFEENSELKIIEKSAFYGSPINHFQVPSSIENNDDEWWICLSPNLNNLNVIKNDIQNISNYNDDFILSKSDSKSEIFDTLIFARKDIETAVIPSFIKKIGKYAFYNCSKLKKVEFEKNSQLRCIENYAFCKSSIESLSIPSSVVELEDYWCHDVVNLTNIEIIENGEKNVSLCNNNRYLIGKSNLNKNEFDVLLFAVRDITTAIISGNITTINSHAFDNCKNLKRVEITIDSKLKKIGKYAFSKTGIESFTISPHITQIEEGAFHSCSCLKTVKFHKDSKIRQISSHMFTYSSIESILIPSTINYIRDDAFFNCKNLKTIEFEQNSQLHIIGSNSFSFLKEIESISIPSSVTLIMKSAFYSCENMKLFKIPENSELRIIQKMAFWSCSSIEKVFIPKHCKKISYCCFYQCDNLKKVEFADRSELKSIGQTAFAYSQIDNIVIPSSVSHLGKNALSKCKSIDFVFIPKNTKLRKLPEYFLHSSSIKKILIPSKITKIEKYAFSKCRQLQSVDFSNNSQIKEIGKKAFVKSNIECISIPSSIEKLENGWCNEMSNLTYFSIKPNLSSQNIKSYEDKFIIGKFNSKSHDFNVLLLARKNLVDVLIPSFIKKIASGSFQGCSTLRSIEFEKNSQLEIIEKLAFSNSNIKTIEIPSKVTRIEDHAFDECQKLEYVTCQKDSRLIYIGESAFINTSIVGFTIQSSLVYIDSNAFGVSLQIIEIEENSKLDEINDFTDNYESLELVMIPFSLNKLIPK